MKVWDYQSGHPITVKTFEYSTAQQTLICSKLTIETLEKGVKYVQS